MKICKAISKEYKYGILNSITEEFQKDWMLCLKSLLNSIHTLHDCSICLSGVKFNVKKMLLVFFKITNDIIGITQQTKTHEEHKIIWCLSHE